MDAERINELRALLDRAAPRPWIRMGFEITRPEVDIVQWSYADLPPAEWEDAAESAGRSLDLIVAAVNELAGLLDSAARCEQLEAALASIRTIVDEQAEDKGLWAIPLPLGTQPIMEAYLQQELRRLHAVVELAAVRGEGSE